jgi:hypothetical protein
MTPDHSEKVFVMLTALTLACTNPHVVADDSDEIPCEPRRVLQAVCQRCHTRPTAEGAPFALVARSDILPVREDMIEQLDAGRMPLEPVTISDEDRATLLDWLARGAPRVAPQECSSR